MLNVLFLSGLVVSGVVAARSTWSPCGLSMLSSITPFSERGRGHRYRWTASWYVAGAVVGGACLGGLAAMLARLVAWSGLAWHPAAVGAIGAALALAGAGVDAGAFGPVLPLVRRQVDDRWLTRYRPWFYGAGFGWQIGFGLATYLMSAGVLLLVGLAGLTGSPLLAVAMGAGFGLARGLTVFLTCRCDTPARLRALHLRLDQAGALVRWAAAGVQGAAGVALVVAAAGPGGHVPRSWAVLAALVVPPVVLVATIGGGVVITSVAGRFARPTGGSSTLDRSTLRS